MINKHNKTTSIRTAAQLRIMASPVSIEIIQAIRASGPVTIAELGPCVGRKANSLHYHVRKLVQHGFLQETATQRSGARTQAIYDVTADVFRYENAPSNKKIRSHVNDIVASMLRLAARNFAHASERPADLIESGAYRNIRVDRFKARLSKAELAEVNKHLRAALDIFIKSKRTTGGELCTLTVVMTPDVDKND